MMVGMLIDSRNVLKSSLLVRIFKDSIFSDYRYETLIVYHAKNFNLEQGSLKITHLEVNPALKWKVESHEHILCLVLTVELLILWQIHLDVVEAGELILVQSASSIHGVLLKVGFFDN